MLGNFWNLVIAYAGIFFRINIVESTCSMCPPRFRLAVFAVQNFFKKLFTSSKKRCPFAVSVTHELSSRITRNDIVFFFAASVMISNNYQFPRLNEWITSALSSKSEVDRVPVSS